MPCGIFGEKCGSQVCSLESWAFGPLETQGTHSTVGGCLKCKIFPPACCRELCPLGLKLGFLLNTDMCAHCARNLEGIKNPKWQRHFTSPAFRVLSWLLPQEKSLRFGFFLSKIAVLKWPLPWTPVSSMSGMQHPAWDKEPRAAGRWQSEWCSGKVLRFTTVFILQISSRYPPLTKCHSKDLDLSTPTKKPKAVLSDNLTGTQGVHSKICD